MSDTRRFVVKKRGKKLSKIIRIILLLFILFIIGLFINNRIGYARYKNNNNSLDYLTEKELNDIKTIYTYLEQHGSENISGFDGRDIDLILYNEKYDFLCSSREMTGQWEYVSKIEAIDRSIYRRPQKDKNAFAVKIEGEWVGSFATHDYYNQSILEQIPVWLPPQFFTMDDEYYRAVVIHEMAHAFQGKQDDKRLIATENYHDISNQFISNKAFKTGINEESKYLALAIEETDIKNKRKDIDKFLEARDKRRAECGYDLQDIEAEMQFEWLEGCGRYMEYETSRDSNSMISKGLGDIEAKCKVSGDDLFYTLGMAQYIIMNQMGNDWEKEVFEKGMTPEEYLRKLEK